MTKIMIRQIGNLYCPFDARLLYWGTAYSTREDAEIAVAATLRGEESPVKYTDFVDVRTGQLRHG